MISQLGYIGLEVSDVSAWTSLLSDVLGLHVDKPGDDGVTYWRMDEYNHRIAISQGPADDLIYAGWQATTAESFQDARKALDNAGIETVDGTESEIKARRVEDMFRFVVGGLPMEIFWGPAILWDQPLRFGQTISGFKTGEGGLGHIVVQTPEMESAVKVFTDILGFRVSDYIWEIAFLRCNPRHHSLAIEPVEGEAKKLAHIMLEVHTLDDVGAAWDRVRATKTPFMKTIGKHSNDHMISFYLTSPSGFDIEYGFGGLLVNEDKWAVSRHRAASVWGHKRPNQA